MLHQYKIITPKTSLHKTKQWQILKIIDWFWSRASCQWQTISNHINYVLFYVKCNITTSYNSHKWCYGCLVNIKIMNRLKYTTIRSLKICQKVSPQKHFALPRMLLHKLNSPRGLQVLVDISFNCPGRKNSPSLWAYFLLSKMLKKKKKTCNIQIKLENPRWVWCDCDSHLMKPPGLAARTWLRLPSYNTSQATCPETISNYRQWMKGKQRKWGIETDRQRE